MEKSPEVAKWMKRPPGFEKRVSAIQPVGRIGDCEPDIGPFAVFLASNASQFVTGHTLPADGGSYMIR